MLPERVSVTECPGCGDGLLIEGEKAERAEQTPPSLWFYVDADQRQVGPVAEQRAVRLVQQGIITRDTLVWRPGMPDWQRMVDSRLGQVFGMYAGQGLPGAAAGAYPVPGLPQGLAVGGLVTGIISIVFSFTCMPVGFAVAIAAMVFSGLALQQVKAGKAGGRGMAIAGLVLSVAGIATVVIMILVMGLAFHWKLPGMF
jgi:hypothetical protein